MAAMLGCGDAFVMRDPSGVAALPASLGKTLEIHGGTGKDRDPWRSRGIKT